jgi:hypothetical protein
MILRTDTIGHFDNPTESIIRDAIIYSGEGAYNGDVVKLMKDEGNYISIWIGKRTTGHALTLRSEKWKLDCSEKLSTEKVIGLFCDYLRGNMNEIMKLKWKRPIDKELIDNLLKLH